MILVTGATGFLGHSLVPRLVEMGMAVRALVRSTSDVAWLEQLGVELCVGDISNREAVGRAMQDVQQVIHAAALFRFWGTPAEFERTNVRGTAHVLEAAAAEGVTRLVYISTVVVIGKPQAGRIVDEQHPCQPLDDYQRTKYQAEKMVRAYVQEGKLQAIILRPGAYYGPGGRYAWNRLFFEDAFRGLRVQIFGGQRLTFPVYVADVASSIIAALNRGTPGAVYNICDTPLTHSAASAIVSRAAGISAFRLNIPAGLMLLAARLLTALARITKREPFYPVNLEYYVFPDWPVSSDKARAELGFTPTPIETGIQNTVAWYRQIGLLKKK